MQEKMLDLSAIRILVVDDNSNMRSLVKYIIRVLGVQALKEASDGAEAFTILKTFNADIIVTDWMMDPLDGIDFTRLIRTAKDSPNPMVPIIMLSGFTEAQRIVEARDAGVTEFVGKPISPKALYLRIAEVILRGRQFVRTKDFFGPDRRRHSDTNYKGMLRRAADQENDDENG